MNTKNCRGVAAIRNFHGDVLPYSVQSTIVQVIEWANDNLIAKWKKHEERGDKIEHFLLVKHGNREEMIAYIDEYLNI